MSYVYVSSDKSQPDFLKLLNADTLAFDVEATGTNVGTALPYGFSLAYSPDNAFYSPIENMFFKGLLAYPNKLKIAYNAIYDRSEMKKVGVVIDNLCDPMIAAHLLEEEQLSLKMLAAKYLWVDIVAYTDLKRPFASMSIGEMAEYSGPHSATALRLWQGFEKRLRKLDLLGVFWDVEMPLVPVLSDMELNGVMVDRGVLSELGKVYDAKMAALGEALDYWSGTKGVNFNSPDQAAKVFYDKLKIPQDRRTTRTGKPSVDKRYLETIKGEYPIISLYMKFKEYKTLKNSYVTSLSNQIQDNKRVYGSFNQTRTRTGRLSSSDPNLQKIPTRTDEGRLIRSAFIAPEGKVLMKSDYDLVELKALAIKSKNPALLEAFRAGKDIHTETAIKAFGSEDKRGPAKTLDYQIVYGGGKPAHRRMFFKAYPGIEEWIDETTREARSMLYTRTGHGRIRTIPEYDPDRYTFIASAKALAHGDREVISTIIQGTCAEEAKLGMRRAWEKTRDSDVKMLMQVHDELVFEVPEDLVQDVAKVLHETMTCHDYEIPLTVTVKAGKNWAEMKEVN